MNVENDNTDPKAKPFAYTYIRMTAQNYLKLGPEEYKSLIAHDWPLESLSTKMLAKIESGMKQILESRGLTCDKPFTGLDIDGFYRLSEMLDLKTERQEATFYGNDQFLDTMHMIDSVTGERIILYNAVPMPV